MPEDALRRYNSAFLTNRIDPALADTCCCPDGHADAISARSHGQHRTSADGDGSGRCRRPDEPAPAHTHTVRAGESLWLIAKRYALSVTQLRRGTACAAAWSTRARYWRSPRPSDCTFLRQLVELPQNTGVRRPGKGKKPSKEKGRRWAPFFVNTRPLV